VNPPYHRSRKYFSASGLITVALVLLGALCAADQAFHAHDYISLSWVLVGALSFPLGWLADSLANVAATWLPAGHDNLKFLFIFSCGAAGTVLNIHLCISAIVWYFRKSRPQRPREVLKTEFPQLLGEHQQRQP
jgi:hypothetical protein